MKLQHTPGPWEFKGSMHMRAYLVNGGDRYICSVWDHLREDDNGPMNMDEEMQANARLIAAAPEMLEELTTIFKGMNEYDCGGMDDYSTIRLKDLIEKATGMSIEEVLSQ